MRSIARHLDEYDIAQEVRVERRAHKGSFLLLEGVSDIKRFDPFIDSDTCSLINCYGRPNAVGAIEILYDEGFLGAVAIVDADFDRIVGGTVEHEGLIYSESHDLDLDWATDALVDRFLAEHGEKEKCTNHGTSADIIQKIFDGLKPVSVAKLLNKRGVITHRLKNINVALCCDGFTVDLNNFVAEIQANPPLTSEQQRRLATQISNASAVEYDPRQLTNGHDFYAVLGVALRNELGSRREAHTWASEIEAHFRLMFSRDQLQQTSVWRQLVSWERENAPFTVLDRAFA
jgi:hypothetical protein